MIIYDNITVNIDGVETLLTDLQGNAIEPFLMDNVMYVPISPLVRLFGRTSTYVAATRTLYIATPRVAGWLDQMGNVNFSASGPDNHFVTWPTERVTTAGDTFARGFLFRLGNWCGSRAAAFDNQRSSSNLSGAVKRESTADPWLSYQEMDFLLNGQYSSFRGTIVCAASDRAQDNQQGAQVRVYGNGFLIYTSPPISAGTRAVEFNVDVSLVRILRIYVHIPNVQTVNSVSGSSTYVGVVNARFER
jgi:hypothetical protein